MTTRPSPARRPILAFAASLLAANAAGQAVLQTFPLNHLYDNVILIGDVDGDGVRDLAFERWIGSTVSRQIEIYSMSSGALLLHLAPAPQEFIGRVAQVGDLDNDGRDDFAYGRISPVADVIVLAGGTWSQLHAFPATGPGGLRPVGIDDVNGNGGDDLFLSDSLQTANGHTYAGRADLIDGMTGQVLRTHLGTYPSENLVVVTALGDLDGDGMRDYLISTNSHWRGHSGATGQLLFSLPKLSYTYGWDFTDVGDVNADGFDDVAFTDRGNAPYITYEEFTVLAGPSATPLWNHLTLFQNPGTINYAPTLGRLGDLDGDGHADFGWGGGETGVASTILAGRDYQPLYEFPVQNPPQAIAWYLGSPGDGDGDGIGDLLFYDEPQPGVFTVQFVSSAPPGTATLGQPCPGPAGHRPTIGVGIGPRLGRTMTVNLSGANPSLFAALLGVGYDDQQWNGVPLPLDLAALGLPG